MEVKETIREAVRLCLESELWYYLPEKEKAAALYYVLTYFEGKPN